MRKLVTISAIAAGLALAVTAPTTAQARFGAGAIAEAVAATSSVQPVQYYYRGYRGYRPYYSYSNPPVGSWDYRFSRDALNTCAYC